ncbi:hypothetical protein JHN63_51465 [Streptomyces sp. MBT65]|uniref:hypothetical protein n=1 Tax=Streptomyces sp. MBT65 TaxID=1488395 RepID=UPI00190A1077|nr:hypothetical protein [Streptomyces sp. MBT65]MBK3582018.1 hypothetical protein [Streptomyces sp. MBT65]
MQTRGRKLRFTAVLALTVLTLTGFSTGRHHSSRHGSSGGGGGCSSSRQDHDTSSSTTGGSSEGSSYTHQPNYRSTPTSTASSGSGSSLRDGTAKLVSCATATRQYATVEVSNPNDRKATFSVNVTFEDAQDNEVDYNYADVKVPANGRATVRVRFLGSSTPVDHCVVDRRATAVS